MTTEQLRGMADEAFVEILAQRVVEKLLARQKQALRNNLETLRSFGARLTTSGGLYDKALRAVGGAQARTAAPAARPEAAPRKQEGAARIRLEGRVLSGRHVQGCPPHSTLWVPRETLITQLAADEARRRDICIRKET